MVEHGIDIQRHPEVFGLTERDVRGATLEDLRKIAVEKLIMEGWLRFRFLDNEWNFEAGFVQNALERIEEILTVHNAQPHELVKIEQVKPKREYKGTVAEFYDRTMFRYYELWKKNAWRMS